MTLPDRHIHRRRGSSPALLLTLLLPLTAFVAPLLRSADTAAAGPQPPPLVRQRLERALSDGSDDPQHPPVLSKEGTGYTSGSLLWCGERFDRKGGSVQAVCDEATGEITLFRRDRDTQHRDDDCGLPVRTATDAKNVVVSSLYRLSKRYPSSWKLTMKPPTSIQYAVGCPMWCLRGVRGRRYFEMNVDPTTGTMLFYSEGQVFPDGSAPAGASGR